MGGSLKRVPHQLGVSLLVSAKWFAEAGSSIDAGRAWGWLGTTTSNYHASIVLQTTTVIQMRFPLAL